MVPHDGDVRRPFRMEAIRSDSREQAIHPRGQGSKGEKNENTYLSKGDNAA